MHSRYSRRRNTRTVAPPGYKSRTTTVCAIANEIQTHRQLNLSARLFVLNSNNRVLYRINMKKIVLNKQNQGAVQPRRK